MEQPVKAAERSDSHSEEQVTERRQSKTYGEGYTESYRKGYDEGYDEGFKKDIPQYPENNKNVINNKNYTPDSIRGPYDAYSDGFDSGYAAGWHKANDGGNLHHQESQSSDEAQDKVEESTGDSNHKESPGNHEIPNEGKNSTNDPTISDLLYDIVGTFLTLVLSWFNSN
ncbi:Uncharacterised protein [Streptococcus pyogenes]|uniref:hypothetical protein n=1 Tax=Streptococcus pyogenes TaxID=1314 RepID=UPI000DA2EB92|nr:hypothetical protein [Streptococcus pyogenes]SQE79304.1 Uncharacterised protein [Streptococcus pyogenes]